MLPVILHVPAPVSDALTFTGLSLGLYQRVRLCADEVRVGTDGDLIDLLISTGSGFTGTGYRYTHNSRSAVPGSDAVNQNNPAVGASIRVCGGGAGFGIGNAATKSCSITIDISPGGSALHKLVNFNSVHIGPGGSIIRNFGGGLLELTNPIDGLQLKKVSGTMPAGKATLYGFPTSS